MKVDLKRDKGILKIDINGKIIEPLSFKSFRPTKRNISDFYKAGVRVFSILSTGLNSALGVKYSLYGESWTGDKKYDFEKIDNQIDLFLKNAPDAYFALMLQVDTRDWYLEKNPACPDSFTNLSQVLGNDEWKEAAAEYIKEAVSHVEEKYGERFYGYFLLGGTTTEWFSELDFEEGHPYKLDAYKKHLGRNDVVIPPPQDREIGSEISFVEDREIQGGLLNGHSSNVVTYRKFHADLIADAILYFAKVVKEATNREKLVGVYFGYLFELCGSRLWNAGHIGYEKVFTSDDIDIISSPSHYGYRKYNDCTQFMLTYETLNKHNKLYYLEFDHITHLAPGQIEGKNIPGVNSRLLDEDTTIDVMRRDFMMCLTKGAALWWFDMFEGWFYSEGMMNEVKSMIEIIKNAPDVKSAAEIAVIATPEALYHTNKNSKINNDFLCNQLRGFSYMGMPYDVYSMCDLKNLDFDKYKLYIFLTPFKISSEDKKIIDEKIKVSGKSALWFYAPNYIGDKCFDISGMKEITGMNIEEFENLDKVIKTVNGQMYDTFSALKPSFYVNDDAKELATYEKSGKISVAMKDLGGFKSFYSARGKMPSYLLKEIAKEAGCHIYCNDNIPVYISENIIGVYTNEETELFVKSGTYKEVFSDRVYDASGGIIKIEKDDRMSKLFFKIS